VALCALRSFGTSPNGELQPYVGIVVVIILPGIGIGVLELATGFVLAGEGLKLNEGVLNKGETEGVEAPKLNEELVFAGVPNVPGVVEALVGAPKPKLEVEPVLDVPNIDEPVLDVPNNGLESVDVLALKVLGVLNNAFPVVEPNVPVDAPNVPVEAPNVPVDGDEPKREFPEVLLLEPKLPVPN